MEKSIETIWKEGFVKNDTLIVPKINDLYNQKSIDLVSRFKRRYRVNVIFIALFSVVVLPVSYLVDIPYMGILIFLLFGTVVFRSSKIRSSLDVIDNSLNSYEYLVSFHNWMEELITLNAKFSRFLYPYMFIAIAAGNWFGTIGGDVPGTTVVDFFVREFPNLPVVYGVPLALVLCVILILFFLAMIGASIGTWDFNIVYGGLRKRLKRTIADMEELKQVGAS